METELTEDRLTSRDGEDAIAAKIEKNSRRFWRQERDAIRWYETRRLMRVIALERMLNGEDLTSVLSQTLVGRDADEDPSIMRYWLFDNWPYPTRKGTRH